MKKLLVAVRQNARPLFLSSLFFGAALDVSAQKTIITNKPQTASSRLLYGEASFYANKFNGRQTASGEIFNQNKFTAACNVLPFGTWIKVTNIRNGKSVVVKVNDRLHPKMKRLVDLSEASATKLGYTARGVVRVKVEVIGKNKPL
ncbi:MAG: septal ring lytic transglycosylase RlpA family protein [Ferruginibacter sp.]|nr:septal ring lytic transglycosylase RlpA family protein [Ferruginibacter sp.]